MTWKFAISDFARSFIQSYCLGILYECVAALTTILMARSIGIGPTSRSDRERTTTLRRCGQIRKPVHSTKVEDEVGLAACVDHKEIIDPTGGL